MTFHYRYRKQIIIISIIVIMIISSISAFIYFYEPPKKKTIDTIKVKKKKEQPETEEDVKKTYMVDIKGEVITPGIYELEKDSRIIDVINEAGGLTESADTSVINLSKKITDEMVIIIYSKKEVENWLETKEQESYLQEKCISREKEQTPNDACIEENTEGEKQTATTVNINTATKEELMTLSGIGETKADAIIAYRQKTPFQTIEDIKNVSGIGDSTYEEIKNNITV